MEIEIDEKLTEDIKTQVKAWKKANGEINPTVNTDEISDFCFRASRIALSKGWFLSEEDPNDGTNNEKEAKRRRGVDTLTATEIDDILRASTSAENNRDHLILTLLAKYGFQPGEICGKNDRKSKEWEGGLHRRDIDFKRQILSVYSVRGEKTKREVSIDEVTLDSLRRYIKNADDLDGDYIFHNISYNELIDLPRKYGRRAKVQKKVSCRSFRHFFIANQFKKGTDMLRIRDLAGHKSLSTTRRYMALK